MKLLVFCLPFFFIASHSFTQVPGISKILPTKDSINFQIDINRIKIQSRLTQLAKGDSELISEVSEIITGGLPGTYRDLNNSMIQVINPEKKKPAFKMSNKEQNLATQ